MMNSLLKFGLIAITVLTTMGQPAAAEIDGFSVDVRQAMAQAAEENKDVLMDFSGSDWCGWCMRLTEEVFGQKEFQSAARENFVLVELDFPNDESGLARETLQQNARWQEKLDVEGFPAIYLLDSSGRPYAITGYQPGGPQRYVEHLDELRGIREQRDELFAMADKTSGIDRANLLDRGLDAVGMELALAAYTDEVDEIVRLDADDAAGLRAKYEEPRMRATYRRLLPAIFKVASEQGPEAALDRLDATEKRYPVHGNLALHLVAVKAHFLGEVGRLPDALELFATNIETAQDDPSELRVHLMKAKLLAYHDRTEDALEAVDAASQLSDDRNVLAKLEDLKQAILEQENESDAP